MTDKKTEALKLALEALEDAKKNHGLVYVTELCAIREALAEQPAQQQCMEHGECFGGECIYPATQPAQQQEPVFKFQMQLKPGWGSQYPTPCVIGDPDLRSLFSKIGDVVTFYTSPQPAQQQEPQPPYEFERYVAGSLRAQGVRVERATTLADAMRIAAKICPPANPPSAPTVLVYTPPPASKPWVGLTYEEITEIHDAAFGKNIGVATGLTEAKLREKNT